MRTYLRQGSLFILACFLLVSLPPHAAAQAPAITWKIVAGFNGTFRLGSWLPVDITIANTGDDLSGYLEWRWPNGRSRWQQALDLPRGAQKRVMLPVVAEAPFGTIATLQYVVGDRIVASEKVHYNQVDSNSLVVGVLSNTTNALASLNGLHDDTVRAQNGTGTVLVRVPPDQMPDRPELLQSLDILFITNIDTTNWTDAQRSALALWVADGGRVVLGGDHATTSAGLGSLAPATVEDVQHTVAFSALAAATRWRPRDPNADLAALKLTPAPTATTTIDTPDGIPLVVQRAYGGGQAIQLAFDPTVLDSQGDAIPFWEALLPWSGQGAPWQRLRANGEWLLRNALVLPELALPSIWKLLAFLLVYIAVIGPLNYLLLRRLDRREWAYITIPAAAILFTVGAYFLGVASRSGVPTATALSVVRAAPGTTSGQSLSYLGIFSPVRRSYEVSFAPEALISNASLETSIDTGLTILRTESSADLRSFMVDVGGLRPLLVEQTASAPQLDGSYRHSNGAFQIDIVNRSSTVLEDVVAITGNGTQKIGDLGPGERRQVTITEKGDFGQVVLRNDGVINRTDALNVLSNSWIVPPVAPAPGGSGAASPSSITIGAWSAHPQTSLTLNGARTAVQGATLYAWTLAEVR